MNETALLKSAKKLDRNSLATIFDIYAPAVYQYCFRLSQDSIESDDLVGEVFSKLLENIASDRGPVINLKLFIFQLTYQVLTARDEKRPIPEHRVTRARSDVKQPLTLMKTLPENELSIKVLTTLKNDLTFIQRHVLLLRYLERFSLQETAIIVGKSVNNVKVIQYRALARLSQVLEPFRKPGSLGFASSSKD